VRTGGVLIEAVQADDKNLEDWLLTSLERGNPATLLDERHAGKVAWSAGNEVRPLVHGAVYFAELLAGVDGMRAGDSLLFTDWRGDCDELLAGVGSEVAHVLCAAARRGVVVKGLVWRSHPDRLRFSARENRHLGDVIEVAGGECLLDTRVRPGGSHHQKFVVLRHPGRPGLDVAYVGGIDLSHSRHDDAGHAGDPQAQPIAAVYGDRPPWHDIQVGIRGPAVGDVEAVFRERWEDPAPLSRNPVHRLRALLHPQDTQAGSLPPQLPDPAPRGSHTVQLLRTYPNRRRGYTFAPDGERSIARSYLKVLRRARPAPDARPRTSRPARGRRRRPVRSSVGLRCFRAICRDAGCVARRRQVRAAAAWPAADLSDARPVPVDQDLGVAAIPVLL
jgi:phosphatidylserine/phosphatidylglycerophosphate/cardiolipin synthase-like enzyme